MDKKNIIQERSALIEMYKAGFLDGYRVTNRVRSKEEWLVLNKFYKLKFFKRFEKKLNKEMKK